MVLVACLAFVLWPLARFWRKDREYFLMKFHKDIGRERAFVELAKADFANGDVELAQHHVEVAGIMRRNIIRYHEYVSEKSFPWEFTEPIPAPP
jgi:hypothetical protein